MATSTEIDYKELMKARIDRRLEEFTGRCKKVKRWIDQDRIGGGEANRIWVEEQIHGLEHGLDIACGDFVVGVNSEGVEQYDSKFSLGATYYRSGDALTNLEDGTCDYVTTNYLEAFVDTLKALREWHRLLKPNGLLLLACCDTDKYDHSVFGPFDNKNRSHCFTKRTIQAYVARAGFRDIQITEGEGRTMRVRAVK